MEAAEKKKYACQGPERYDPEFPTDNIKAQKIWSEDEEIHITVKKVYGPRA